MNTTDYGCNGSITFAKSSISRVFNCENICNNKFMADLSKGIDNIKPGLSSYGAILNYMPEAIENDSTYNQKEIVVIAPPKKTGDTSAPVPVAETVEYKSASPVTNPVPAVAKAVPKNTWDIDLAKMQTLVTPKATAKVQDIPMDNIKIEQESKIKPSKLDVDPKMIAETIKKQKEMMMPKEDLSFLKNA